MDYFLILITVTICFIYDVLKKVYVKNLKNGFNYYSFVFGTSIISVFVFLFFGIKNISAFTVGLGCLFGVITLISVISFLKAVKIGLLSYTCVISSLSTIIPTISGSIFWGEKIGFLQITGVFLMLISLVLSVVKSENNKKSFKIWYFYCIILFVSTGLIGVLQKVFQDCNYSGQSNEFLLIAFLTNGFISGIIAICTQKKSDVIKESDSIKQSNGKILLYIGIIFICGICCAFNNKINLYLSGRIKSAILFPLLNGGGATLTTIASLVIFKEKLMLRQKIGIFVGIIAIILLCV